MHDAEFKSASDGLLYKRGVIRRKRLDMATLPQVPPAPHDTSLQRHNSESDSVSGLESMNQELDHCYDGQECERSN